MLNTPCPEKDVTLFSTTTLAFLRRFLQRGRIACSAERCINHGNSVRLSVRLSVTRWYRIQTNEDRIMRAMR